MRVSSSIISAIAILSGFAPAAAADKYTYFSDQEYTGRSGDKTFGLAPAVAVLEQKSLRPVAWFAAFKPDGGKSQFLYLLIFKTPADYSAAFEMSGQVRGSSDDGAEGKTAAVLGKQKVEVAYRFATDPKTHAVHTQSLTIGGREVKAGDPRVFVVDVTRERVTYTPVKVALPTEAPDVSQAKREGWDAALERALEQLKKDSPKLKNLLEVPK